MRIHIDAAAQFKRHALGLEEAALQGTHPGAPLADRQSAPRPYYAVPGDVFGRTAHNAAHLPGCEGILSYERSYLSVRGHAPARDAAHYGIHRLIRIHRRLASTKS